jgi:hypothetical protein
VGVLTPRHRERVAIVAGVGTAAVAVAIGLALLVGRGGNSTTSGGRGGAVAAQDVVASIGVNVHLSYFDTAYSNFAGIEARLKPLGIRNVRDGACAGCVEQNERLRQLGLAGMRLNLIMGDLEGRTGSLPELLGLVRGQLAPFVTSVEGPNESDNQGDSQWVPQLKSYQQLLYRGIKDDPKLRHITVLGPSLVHPESYRQLGDMSSSLDAANLHSYPPNGGPPAANVADQLRLAELIAPGKPLASTETGYRTGGPPFPGNRPVSEERQAAYLPALLLEYYRSGIRRSFIYELVDEKPDPRGEEPEQHFGLLRQDLSPKPSYFALQNLISLLSVGGPAGGALEAPLASATTLDGSRMHTLTIQRGDGAQVLAMWLTTPAPGDAVTRNGVTHPVALELGGRAAVEVYRPSLSARPQTRLGSRTDLEVELGADPLLVVIHPAH